MVSLANNIAPMSLARDPLAPAAAAKERRGAPEAFPDAPHHPAALAEGLRPLILKLSRQLRREAQRAGVSSLDAQFLAIVHRLPGIGVSELADLEQMSRPTMSAHVKRLLERGLVRREGEAPTGDRRRVRLSLTPAGEAARLAVKRSRNDWLMARLGALDEGERLRLAAAVEPLARLLAERGPSA
jgi:DNA-binding MarR family transcriptional regulator